MSISGRGTRWAAEGAVLAALAFLYFVDLFLPWSQSCLAPVVLPFQPAPGTFSPSALHVTSTLCAAQTYGWGGAGTVAGVLVALLVLWEATRVARLGVGIGVGYRSLVSSALAFGVLIFTIVNVAARLTWMSSTTGPLVYGGTFLWIALALAILIGLGGVAHWRLWQEYAPHHGAAGGPSSAGDSVTIPPEAPPPPPPGVCPSCGRVNPEDSRFCSACGKSLTESTTRRRGLRRSPPPA
ncbi:MAG TPA: zinc ribbon domain-containing protein [Candidatus Acidoferrales bacterium]|nr:zinc ribbon domain-containing protein [Candidatus Acidoferrales bacterium]